MLIGRIMQPRDDSGPVLTRSHETSWLSSSPDVFHVSSRIKVFTGHRCSLKKGGYVCEDAPSNQNVLTDVQTEQLPWEPRITRVPCPPPGLQLFSRLLWLSNRGLRRQFKSADVRHNAALFAGNRSVAVQAARRVRLRGVSVGQHTAPGAPAGVLRTCPPVAHRRPVHSAPWRDGGRAGDHAESGPG